MSIIRQNVYQPCSQLDDEDVDSQVVLSRSVKKRTDLSYRSISVHYSRIMPLFPANLPDSLFSILALSEN